jgi:hypothetical protein
MRRAYGYHVVTRNCATELIKALNSSFADDAARLRALGGRLEPSDPLAFIPFGLHDLVTDRLRTADRFVLPSYRTRALAVLASRENPLWIHLAEMTTATSALYASRPGDTTFLLFTDEMPLLRPAYGAVNLAYGLVHAGAGVASAAFDEGERLREGLRGALFSLPELAFFNIRKGSFGRRILLDTQ